MVSTEATSSCRTTSCCQHVPSRNSSYVTMSSSLHSRGLVPIIKQSRHPLCQGKEVGCQGLRASTTLVRVPERAIANAAVGTMLLRPPMLPWAPCRPGQAQLGLGSHWQRLQNLPAPEGGVHPQSIPMVSYSST